jgi:hypothetical protein
VQHDHQRGDVRMKKLLLLFAVLLLVGLAPPTQAADLEAGWYVKLGGFFTLGFDGAQWHAVDWSFVGGLGTFGPFEVTSPHPWWPQREIRVPGTTTAPTGTALYFWLEPEVPVSYDVYEAVPRWETSYDASRMRLEMLIGREGEPLALLWAQDQSGSNWGYHNVLTGLQHIPAGYQPVLRVVVLPEPGCLMCVVCGSMVFFIRRFAGR